ncbi:MAG: hypothetical protein JWN08_2056 [Frankiales bacterium]|jgi:uncharacterized RDD family membrane protein YckC|nr:hypothetical protein [Frankiales bacterium]
MARWTGTWLSGLGAAGVDTRPDGWRGRRLGLPPEGAGSIATTGSRVAAFLVDLVAGGLIGGLVNVFVVDPTPLQRTLAGNGAFALEVLLLTALTGQSLGMKLVGIRVVRLAEPAGPPGFLPSAVRLALLCLLLPALIFDRDGRGLHDKAAGTAVVKATSKRSFADDD